jgi:5-methylcytosine-specific restriction protein A
MPGNSVADAISLLTEAVDRVRADDSRATDVELVDGLAQTRESTRLVARLQVETVGALQRRGVFAAMGNKRPDSPVAEVLTVDRRQAREIVRVAEHVCTRVDLQGQVLPPVLPGMTAAFAAGQASLQHVDLIARLMDSAPARRIPPSAWAGIEEQIGIQAKADVDTPTELLRFGQELIRRYDQDGPEPDAPEPAQVNELRVTPLPGGGGRITGTFEDPVRFAQIATVIGAKAAPLTAEDQRSPAERNADALAEVCGFVLEHGDKDVLPSSAGLRPQVMLLMQLTDLENRATAGCLDIGSTPTPAAARQMCCDGAVIPVVLNSAGMPLDVGRRQRIVGDTIRLAVIARDRGCAHPGCDRPPTWSEVHHIKEWAHGGETKLSNLVMLCRTHHRDIHSTEWEVRIARDGLPEFIPPLWLDEDQKPRRHPRVPPRPQPVGQP